MFRNFSISTVIAALSAVTGSWPLFPASPAPKVRAKRGAVKRRRTGIRYPHSSARQQARYARQIAAGQLRMKGAGE